jgi:hypothetical protein
MEVYSSILRKSSAGEPISVNDIKDLSAKYKVLSNEHVSQLGDVLLADSKRKIVNYKQSNGLLPIIDPLKNTQKSFPDQNQRLKSCINAWLQTEYLMQNDDIWKEFRSGEIEFDELLNKTASKFNELSSLELI